MNLFLFLSLHLRPVPIASVYWWIYIYIYQELLYLFWAMLTQIVLYLKFANHSFTVSKNTYLLYESRRLTETR